MNEKEKNLISNYRIDYHIYLTKRSLTAPYLQHNKATQTKQSIFPKKIKPLRQSK